MPDSGTESKSKQTILLSRLSVILPVLAGVMLFALLVFLGVTANFEIQRRAMVWRQSGKLPAVRLKMRTLRLV